MLLLLRLYVVHCCHCRLHYVDDPLICHFVVVVVVGVVVSVLFFGWCFGVVSVCGFVIVLLLVGE